MQRYLSTCSESEIKNTAYTGPRGKEPGIFAYGPFEYHEEENPPPTALDNRLYVHSTSESDVNTIAVWNAIVLPLAITIKRVYK